MTQENNKPQIEKQIPNVQRILLGFSNDNNVIYKTLKKEYSLAYGSCDKSSFSDKLKKGFKNFNERVNDKDTTIEVNINNYYTSHYISNKTNIDTVNMYNIYILSSQNNIDTDIVFNLNNIDDEYRIFYNSLLEKYSVTTNDINKYKDEINHKLLKDKDNHGSNVYLIIDNLQYIDNNFKYILFDQIHNIPIFSNDLSNTYHILKGLLNLSDDDVYNIIPDNINDEDENENEITKWIYNETGELEPHIYINIPKIIQRIIRNYEETH